MRLFYLIGIAAICGASATSASATAPVTLASSLAASVGVDYSNGDYGAAEATDVVLVPLILRARTGNLALTTSFTYIKMNGPADVVVGPDGEPLPGVPTTGSVREGLSDLSLSAAYTFRVEGARGPQFTLRGRVKLPTSKASDQLSTGEVDYSIRGEVSAPVGTITPFASVGYRVLGNPDGVVLRNGLTASIGASASLGRPLLIASLDYSSASSATAEDARSIFGGVSLPLDRRLNLTIYNVVGLSESSPDHGVGLLFTAQIL